MTVFPTGYTPKGSTDNTDLIWASDDVTNFNITVDNIGDRVFADRDTDNLSEGATNKYYTETRVTNNTTVVGLGNTKEDLTNKSTNITADTGSDTKYPSVKAVEDFVGAFSIPDATETVKGKARLATEMEERIGTDDLTIMTPLKVHNKVYGTGVIASDTLVMSGNTERSDASGGVVKLKEAKIERYPNGGTVRVKVDIKASGTITSDQVRWFLNGTEINLGNRADATASYATVSNDITVTNNDLIQIFVLGDNSPVETIFVKNFTISYDEVFFPRQTVITLD